MGRAISRKDGAESESGHNDPLDIDKNGGIGSSKQISGARHVRGVSFLVMVAHVVDLTLCIRRSIAFFPKAWDLYQLFLMMSRIKTLEQYCIGFV
jgi:hypothetical protein